jgi:hypothetical protein
VLRFGRFYATPAAGDGLSLEWHRVEPDFAVARPTSQEQQSLVDGLVRLLRDGPDRARLPQGFGALREDRDWGCDAASGSGWTLRWCPAASARPDCLTLEFRPPLPGESVTRAAGVVDPVIVSTDAHLTTRYVVDRTAKTFPAVHGYRLFLVDGRGGQPQPGFVEPCDDRLAAVFRHLPKNQGAERVDEDVPVRPREWCSSYDERRTGEKSWATSLRGKFSTNATARNARFFGTPDPTLPRP